MIGQHTMDNKRDRESCRALCSRLSEDELRCRLLRSRALKPKRDVVQKIESGAVLDDRWLEEAATVFDVSPWYEAHPDYHHIKIRGQLKQEHLVELVMRAVQLVKCFAPGSKAADDEDRRARQLSDWEGQQKQQLMRGFAKKHGINPQCKKGEWPDFRRRLLIAGCPENLRLAVVSELVSEQQRAPNPTLNIEAFAHDYLQSALGRRYLSSASGEQLSTEQVSEWQAVLDLLPIGEAPEWQEDPVLLLAKSFYDERGNLDVPKPNAGDEAEAAQLFQGLKVLRRAQDGDSRDAGGRLLRRRLTAHDVLRWEAQIPRNLLWQQQRVRGQYVPGAAVVGSRHEWSRTPYLCRPCGCYLCGEDFDQKGDLVKHWREDHLDLADAQRDTLSAEQVEEEVRKRLFWDEAMSGPFEIRGQEHRRIVGRHAQHQTHSQPGTGRLNEDGPACQPCVRQLGGCVVCARSMWLEDLYEMDLFAKPVADADEPDDDGSEVDVDGGGGGVDDDEVRCTRFSVSPVGASKVDELLSVHRYARRWPRIPKHELWASSVQHPHKPGWRWLLHTRRLPELAPNPAGRVPPVLVCIDCGSALGKSVRKQVRMPKYALANDNWIGRLPFPLRPGGTPLRDMEIRSLARGRMCVKKIIAEPDKKGPRSGRQGGLVGNTIAFPQAKVSFLGSKELPPPPDEAAAFMSESVTIALIGSNVEDLHNAKWAEVRRQEYVDAAEFWTQHDVFYGDMVVNKDRAERMCPAVGIGENAKGPDSSRACKKSEEITNPSRTRKP